MEVWKKIEGFENYEISNLGRLKGLEITTKFGCSFKTYPERICKFWKDKKGYEYFTFNINGKNKHKLIHRLVATAFIPNSNNKPQVNHIDGNKSNNNIENLEWCTVKENLKHARDNGLNNSEGLNHYRCKLTKNNIIEIRENKEKLTQKKLAEKYILNQASVSDIINFKTYKNVRK
jgi:hypothetical protein